MEATSNDPVIEEARAARHRISERVGHDSGRLVAYYMELQERYRGRLIRVASGDKQAPEEGLTHGSSGPATRAAEPGRSASEGTGR